MPNHKKPTELKVVSGTFRKDRAVEQEPVIPKQKHYEPPEDLQGLALTMWNKVMPILCAAKVMADSDVWAVQQYCIQYRNFMLAQEAVEADGITFVGATGEPKKNPACTVMEKASSELRALSAMLGLDPSARTRINVGSPDKKANSFTNI